MPKKGGTESTAPGASSSLETSVSDTGSTESPATLASSMTTVAITSLDPADYTDDSEKKIGVEKDIAKEDLDLLLSGETSGLSGEINFSSKPEKKASVTSDHPKPTVSSDEPVQSDKKKRDPLNSPESSNTASSLKKRKCSREESGVSECLTYAEAAPPELSVGSVISNTLTTVKTPDGDYRFCCSRREFSLVNFETAEDWKEPCIVTLEKLSPNYQSIVKLPVETYLVDEYSTFFPNWNESVYMKYKIRYLFYISKETGRPKISPFPGKVHGGISKAVKDAMDEIINYLVCRTRGEEENVFNHEFYLSLRPDNGYKPPFSNTAMFQQRHTSENVFKIAILFLALADGAMKNTRLAAGIGYCYIAHQMITSFRLLSLLEQPFNVLDHYIRQKVCVAVYKLVIYAKKGYSWDPTPYNKVCACFSELISAFSIATTGRSSWQAHENFHDPTGRDLPFLDFVHKMWNKDKKWAIDSHLAWTTAVLSATQDGQQCSKVIGELYSNKRYPKDALEIVKNKYKILKDFDSDIGEYGDTRIKAIVVRLRGMSLAPLLECLEDYTEADRLAAEIKRDFYIAIAAEQNCTESNSQFNEKLFEDQLIFSLLRLFYHMWEIQKPENVTEIRFNLLSISQAAVEMMNTYGSCGMLPALAALSSIMYLDYTCGMTSEASEISIMKTRMSCHKLAKNILTGDVISKQNCLNLLALKMDELQRSIDEDENNEEAFRINGRILKVAHLAYPVLFYFSGCQGVDILNYSDVEPPADESYKMKPRKFCPPQSGQKLLYLNIPVQMIIITRTAEFLHPVEQENTGIGGTAANVCDLKESKSDEDDATECAILTEEELGSSTLFISNLKTTSQQLDRTSYSATKRLPSCKTVNAALKKSAKVPDAEAGTSQTLPSCSQNVDDSEARQKIIGQTSTPLDGTTETRCIKKSMELEQINLADFYLHIYDAQSSHKKLIAYESSKFEDLLAVPVTRKFADGEENFWEALNNVLRSLLWCVNHLLAGCRGDFDYLRKRQFKVWRERVLFFTNLARKNHLQKPGSKHLDVVVYNLSLVFGYPTRIFVDPESC